jgi:serine/threonine-protein kinase HipA
MSQIFDVYLNEDLAGTLAIDDVMRMRFAYNSNYIDQGGAVISLTMPLSNDDYQDSIVFPFIENLLPEGEVRTLIQKQHKLEEGNFERLIELLGGDVAGAISFQRVNEKPSSSMNADQQPLGFGELSQLLLNIQDKPFNLQVDEKVGKRLSLAGAQNKLPVIIVDGEYFEAGSAPSTHIIKPARKDGRYRSIVYNEYICMKAAKLAGIKVANVALVAVDDQDGIEIDALVIERYDRYEESGVTYRLQQEDLCQIYSIVSSKKYQVSGGPGFTELFSAISLYSQIPVVDDLEALRRIIFNMVIGNYDAHGKNFSFLTGKNGNINLSPAYDLVSTEAYEDLDKSFAMYMDDLNNLLALKTINFERLFESIGKKYNAMPKQLAGFSRAAIDAVQEVVEEFIEDDYYPADIKMAEHIAAIAKNNGEFLLVLLK